MIILFSDGHWDTRYLTGNVRGIMHNGNRPSAIFIGAEEILEEFTGHEKKVDDERFVRYMVSNLVPAVEGDVFCIFRNRRQLMNTVSQIDYVVGLVLDRYSVKN